MAESTFNHFAAFRFRDRWWEMEAVEREEAWRRIVPALGGSSRAELYRVFPTRADVDLLIWTAAPFARGTEVLQRLEAVGHALQPLRRHAEPVATLWGVTRPSQYVGKASERGIDPLDGERRPCLIVYPFAKTAEWYLLEPDERRRLMGGHIGVGREFPEVDQLLLYSFGLGDQEFVVVYETEDPTRFSELVEALRATEVRRYTLKDSPVWVGLRVPAERAASTW